jgi:hypothetical protein
VNVRVFVAVSDGVNVGVFVAVSDGVNVGVFVAVSDGVNVGVFVAVSDGVNVGVAVFVAVTTTAEYPRAVLMAANNDIRGKSKLLRLSRIVTPD